MIKGEPVYINGDGETSRDFCYIDNAVQANLLAATTRKPRGREPGLQRRRRRPHHAQPAVRAAAREPGRPRREIHLQPVHRDFRAGDVRHSLADFGKAQRLLGYAPTHRWPKAWRRRYLVCGAGKVHGIMKLSASAGHWNEDGSENSLPNHLLGFQGNLVS